MWKEVSWGTGWVTARLDAGNEHVASAAAVFSCGAGPVSKQLHVTSHACKRRE